MKKRILIISLCLLLVLGAVCFAACSESTKQTAVETNTTGAVVSDNGGMSVKYGNYVYFINGYAGESVPNTFGEVIRGAIYRVTLDQNGEPDYKTLVPIVPKNIFGEDKSYGGIYILDGYIYYNTTSQEKNAHREYKTNEGILMRTSLDGAKTEVVKKFDDNDVAFYTGDNSKYLAYVIDSVAYSVNPANKEVTLLSKSNKAKPETEEQTVVAYKFVGDYLIYTMYNYADENNYSADYIVWVYNLKNNTHTAILSSDIYNGNTDRTVLYKTTIVNAQPTADGFILYYSKAGNDNGIKDGYYAYTFKDNDMSYDPNKEVRFTNETSTISATRFDKLSNGYVLAFSKNAFYVFDGNKTTDNKVMDTSTGIPMQLKFEKDVTIIDVIESDTEVYAYYLLDSKFYYIRLFDKAENAFSVASQDAVAFFGCCYGSDYTTYDIVDGVIYYVNDDMENNAYYYVVPAFSEITKDTDIASGKLLGKINDSDMVALVCEKEDN